MAVALEQFVKQLTDSGVIAPGKLENFIPPKAAPKSAEELAKELVRQKHLTKFQAQEIYAGRAKSLILGNYTLLDKIGAGGMGQVFKAEHRRMHRIVAIKMLPAATTKDAAVAARFQREVEAAAKLEHPNIVAAHDADEAGGVHFLVMQYVEGSDLSALVKKNGPFSVAKAVNYILQAARGLEYAHKHGVIHRDIKPANLLLNSEGTVKILDMGLARIDGGGDTATQAELTGTGAVMGTVDYMAPEQALSTKHADARADIYSLGCSLCYLLTGKPIYDGETITAKLIAHQFNPIPELRSFRDDIPTEVEAVFQRMVAKKVGERYQTMSEVIAALEQCSSGQQSSLNLQQSVNLEQSASTNGDADVLTFLKEIPLHTADKPKLKPKAKPAKKVSATPSEPRKDKKKLILAAAGAGFLGVVLLAGVLLKLRTKDGTLVVEINQPDAVVQVLDANGKVEISQPGGKAAVTISVDAGKHRLKIEKDGFKFFAKDFEIAAGDTQSIKASLQRLTGEPVDLLKLIDVKRDICFGSFKFEDGALVGDPWSVINLPYLPPADYRLTISATRTGRPETLIVGLIIGSERASADVDANDGKFSGFSLTDGHLLPEQNLVPQKQPYLTEGVPATVVCTVRDSAAEIQVNGKVVAKTSPAAKLSLWPEYSKHHVSPLFIGSWSNFRFTKIEFMPLDPAAPGRVNIEPHSLAIDTPAFQRWMKTVAALPAEQQVEAVVKKLQELNPGFDGKVTGWKLGGQVDNDSPQIENGVVTEFGFATENVVADISPVQALLGLKRLLCKGSKQTNEKLSDLSALRGMRLMCLDCSGLNVSDLSPLRGMPLEIFACDATNVADLSPLKGMPLRQLWCGSSLVSDLSPLKGTPLKVLACDRTHVTDLSPLQGMAIERIFITTGDITKGMDALRQMKSLTVIGTTGENPLPPEEFWKKYDAGEFGKPGSAASTPDQKPITNINDPAFQQWIKTVTALPAEQQVDAVVKKLRELNSGFDGKVTGFDGHGTPKIESGVVTKLRFDTDNAADISPVRALAGLKILGCNGSGPGKGKLSDLSPLRDMSLSELNCGWSQVAELSPLRGMRLERLNCDGDPVSDLSPLGGMPLTDLNFAGTSVTDVSPLHGMNLTDIVFTPKNITKGLEVIRQMKSLQNIGVRGDRKIPSEEFWKKYDAGEFGKPDSTAGIPDRKPSTKINDPAFQQWMKTVAALPAEQQVEAVAKKLQELNPGFDGKETHKIENDVVTELQFVPDGVPDISPVRALTGLTVLMCTSSRWDRSARLATLSDLSPLKGLKLTTLDFRCTNVSDLAPLAGMPLTLLGVESTNVSDLSPLKGMSLTTLWCHSTNVSDLSPLQGMPLETLFCSNTQISDLSPLKKMPLTLLWFFDTKVSDVSPLEGMNLTEVTLTPKNITKGIDAIRQMKSLQKIGVGWGDKDWFSPADFWKKYDAREVGK